VAQLEKANLRSQLVDLRASEDATVLTMAPVSVGSVMQSGDKFLTLVPVSAPLELETAMSGDEAGYVHTGDPVMIKFETFQFTRYGGAEGVVRSISPDSFTSGADDRTRAGVLNSGGATSAAPAYYRANITMDKITLHDTPLGFHVAPGMPVEADIKVGSRTIMGYLLGRVLPPMMEGMREP
jgi:HlyD family secretion protein